MKEGITWASIPGFDGYQASADGQVRSTDRRIETSDNRSYLLRGKLLRTQLRPDGYVVVSIMKDGKSHLKSVHRLVLLAFNGEPPSGMVCCHNDGNRANNHLCNLRWGTPIENQADSVKHGTRRPPPVHAGVKSRSHKLTPDKVRQIRAEKNEKGVVTRLSKEYGVSLMVISKVRRGLAWRHAQ